MVRAVAELEGLAEARARGQATRRLPVVASRIPKKPTIAEKIEPMRKATPRPHRDLHMLRARGVCFSHAPGHLSG